MKFPFTTTAILVLLFSLGSPPRFETRDSSELDPVAQTSGPLKWPKRTIEIAFSTSLNSPGPNIKTGSDVVGAAKRALSRWSSTANINFVVSWSNLASVSPPSGGDGVSLITIADTLDNEAFNADSTTARTRVFFDPETGVIAEADIAINPHPRTAEGADLQFSTDGTPGTYDLEATFTHEIGHLLGLEHSAVLGSTMQARQAFNGTYGLPAFTERTLSEDDRQRVRSLYGPKLRLGKIEGRLIDNQSSTSLVPSQQFNVWAENVTTGRVIASSTTAADGTYSLEGLGAGQYRVLATPRTEDVPTSQPDLRRVRTLEFASQATVKADLTTTLNYNLLPQTNVATLAPRWIGLHGEVSTVAVPLEAGKRFKIYVGGPGVDQVPATSINVTSPYFNVDPSSLTREQLPTPFPVISIEVNVAPSAPFGDYTLRLQSNSGEVAFVPGALTIDPGAAYAVLNPVDDPRFLLAQQYRDLTGHTPDADLLEKMVAQLGQCGTHADCSRTRRLDISTDLFLKNAVQADALFLNGLYLAALGRRPKLAEFESDRGLLSNQSMNAFALTFIKRPEFESMFSSTLNAAQFVDAVINSVKQVSGTDLTAERANLIKQFDGTPNGRVAVLMRVVSNPTFVDSHYNQAFVQGQYFSFLRRDPDENGLASWINVLKNKPLRDTDAARSMVCAFLNSSEYQLRFGSTATHNQTECGN